jgi:peptidoglycan/LPS O-acetylase OafA/YrhL
VTDTLVGGPTGPDSPATPELADPPRTGLRFPALDGLRIIGAVAVVTTHVGFTSGASLNGQQAGLLARLDAGVPLFFVVSGFLLYRPHVTARLTGRPAPALGTYLRHRAARILPALWLAVLGAALLLHHSPLVDTSSFLRYATLTQIYSQVPAPTGLTQMWSLATEWAFYLALPALAWALSRGAGAPRTWALRTIVLLGLLPVGSAVWVAVATSNGGGLPMVWLPAFLGWFGLGMALATWSAAREAGILSPSVIDDLGRAAGSVYAAAAALYLLLCTPIAGPYDLSPPTVGQAVVKNLGYAVLGALLVFPAVVGAAADRPSAVVRALGGRVGRSLGDISYGVFAYHLIVLSLAERAFNHQTFDGQFPQLWLSTIAVTFAVAWISYRAVERPIMRWARRRER